MDFFLQIFDETYICYGGSMVYSRAEYPHCRYLVPVMMLVPVILLSRTDCEQRSQQRCRECIDTNLCTRSLPTRYSR